MKIRKMFKILIPVVLIVSVLAVTNLSMFAGAETKPQKLDLKQIQALSTKADAFVKADPKLIKFIFDKKSAKKTLSKQEIANVEILVKQANLGLQRLSNLSNDVTTTDSNNLMSKNSSSIGTKTNIVYDENEKAFDITKKNTTNDTNPIMMSASTGGYTKLYDYWWGYSWYLSSTNANKAANAAWGAAIVAAWIPDPLMSKCVATMCGLVAADIGWANAGGTGVKINFIYEYNRFTNIVSPFKFVASYLGSWRQS